MDVLSLIAKILSFTDEQLETVGLKVPSKNIFTSIISTFVPGEPKEPTDEVKKSSLRYTVPYGTSSRIWFFFFSELYFFKSRVLREKKPDLRSHTVRYGLML